MPVRGGIMAVMVLDDDEDDLMEITLLLALHESPALMDSDDSLNRRAQEFVALGEDGMRRVAQTLKRRRQN